MWPRIIWSEAGGEGRRTYCSRLRGEVKWRGPCPMGVCGWSWEFRLPVTVPSADIAWEADENQPEVIRRTYAARGEPTHRRSRPNNAGANSNASSNVPLAALARTISYHRTGGPVIQGSGCLFQ